MVGHWVAGEEPLELFAHEGRLFAHRELPRVMEAELVRDGAGHLFSPQAPVDIEIVERRDGKATALVVNLPGRRATARRAGDGD